MGVHWIDYFTDLTIHLQLGPVPLALVAKPSMIHAPRPFETYNSQVLRRHAFIQRGSVLTVAYKYSSIRES